MSRPEEIAPPELVRHSTVSNPHQHQLTPTVLWRHRGAEVHRQVSISLHSIQKLSYRFHLLNPSPSSRIKSIQAQMTARALELLALPEDESAFVLDIGCGSGLSGEMLEEEGHIWVGVDIAPSMLGE